MGWIRETKVRLLEHNLWRTAATRMLVISYKLAGMSRREVFRTTLRAVKDYHGGVVVAIIRAEPMDPIEYILGYEGSTNRST